MGERMAQNAPVQGSAADVFKLAMVELDRALDGAGLRARMILTVHDELVSRGRSRNGSGSSRWCGTSWSPVCSAEVPLVVDLGFGPTWADAK